MALSRITGKPLALESANPSLEADLGTALFEKGQIAEALEHLEKPSP